MSYNKTKILTLKNNRINEKTHILTVLSDKYGKIKVKVFGLNKPKSRFRILALPGILSQSTLYKSKENNNFIITDNDLITNYYSNYKNKFTENILFNYFCDLINEFVPEDHLILHFFDDIINILNSLKENLKENFIFLELYLILRLGYYPDFFNCSNCNVKTAKSFYDIKSYSNFCINCKPKYNIWYINEDLNNFFLKQRKKIMNRNFHTIKIKKNKKIDFFIKEYIINILHKKLKWLEFF